MHDRLPIVGPLRMQISWIWLHFAILALGRISNRKQIYNPKAALRSTIVACWLHNSWPFWSFQIMPNSSYSKICVGNIVVYPFGTFKLWHNSLCSKINVGEIVVYPFGAFKFRQNSLCSKISVGEIFVYPYEAFKLCRIHYETCLQAPPTTAGDQNCPLLNATVRKLGAPDE